MVLDGVFGNPQRFSNLTVGVSAGDERQNTGLSGGERAEVSRLRIVGDCIGEPGVLGTLVPVPCVSVWQGVDPKTSAIDDRAEWGSSGPLQVITEIPSAEKAHWQLNRTAIDKVATSGESTGASTWTSSRARDQGPLFGAGDSCRSVSRPRRGRASHTVDAPGDGVLLAGFGIELDVPVAKGDGRDGCHADQSSSGNYDAVTVPRPSRQSHDRQVWDATAHNPSRGNAAGRKGRNVGVLDKILRAGEGKTLRKLESISKAVNSIEEDYTALSDDELRGLTDEFKARYADGESLDDLMPEAFATVREAARRTLGQRHYDVQIMGVQPCISATSQRCAPAKEKRLLPPSRPT